MNLLRNFMISEDLKVNHAERYLSYIEKYHHEVFQDLKKDLEKTWESEISRLIKKFPPRADAVQDAQLKNSEATVSLTLTVSPEKLVSSRQREPSEVSPSVKIPLIYSRDEREMILKSIIKVSKESIEKTVKSWRELFHYEKNGRVEPWFKVINDHDEIRLQLVVSSGEQETYKTLYSVRVEYGKSGTKTKDFDRLYLISLL